jgi:cell division protein FtsN
MKLSSSPDGTYELDLGRRELGLVVSAFLVASALIFYAGTVLGTRDNRPDSDRASRASFGEPLAAAPADTAPAPPAPPPPAAAPAATPAEPPAPSAPGPYAVQVFATRVRQQAERILERLETKGYPGYIHETTRAGASLYLVRVGGFSDTGAAHSTVRRLQKEEALRGFVTRLGDVRRR